MSASLRNVIRLVSRFERLSANDIQSLQAELNGRHEGPSRGAADDTSARTTAQPPPLAALPSS